MRASASRSMWSRVAVLLVGLMLLSTTIVSAHPPIVSSSPDGDTPVLHPGSKPLEEEEDAEDDEFLLNLDTQGALRVALIEGPAAPSDLLPGGNHLKTALESYPRAPEAAPGSPPDRDGGPAQPAAPAPPSPGRPGPSTTPSPR